MNYISENDLKIQSEYMQMFGCERNSFEAGARWAEKFLKDKFIKEGEKLVESIPQKIFELNSEVKKLECKHTRIEEIQGGQIERCLDCGKTWG